MGQEGYDLTAWFSAEVLEIIFRPLSVTDLLNCSIVSKKWRVAVGRVIQEHKKCFAYVKDPCVDFVKLNEIMGKTNTKIINGLHIQIDPKKFCTEDLDIENIRDPFPHLLNWPFQYINVMNYYEYDKIVCGAVIQLIQEMFWASRESVKELAFKSYGTAPNFFNCPRPLSKWIKRRDGLIKKKVYVFPRLKSIKILGGSFPTVSYFQSFILESAPNLMEIKGIHVELKSLKLWSESAMRRLKCITTMDKQDPTDDETLRKLAKAEPSLQVLKISDNMERDDNAPFPSSWFDPLAQILRNSRYTLKHLDFCASELTKFIRAEGCSDSIDYFPNVTKLEVSVNVTCEPNIERFVLQSLSIGTNFPRLKDLQVYYGGCNHDELNGLEFEWLYEECTPSDLEITLQLMTRFCTEDTLEYFVKTFPLLTSLEINLVYFFDDKYHAYSLSDVFSSCHHLRELELDFQCVTDFDFRLRRFSLDAIFCVLTLKKQ